VCQSSHLPRASRDEDENVTIRLTTLLVFTEKLPNISRGCPHLHVPSEGKHEACVAPFETNGNPMIVFELFERVEPDHTKLQFAQRLYGKEASPLGLRHVLTPSDDDRHYVLDLVPRRQAQHVRCYSDLVYDERLVGSILEHNIDVATVL
jgi:hypothetical protein